MNKYERLRKELEESGSGSMKCFGQSMVPILKSGSKLTFVKQENYEIGDIVFCKVKGHWIDAHLITKKHPKLGFMIANNHGWENGWTNTIFGKAIKSEFGGNTKNL